MNATIAARPRAGLKDLLQIADLDRDGVLTVLKAARRFKQVPLSDRQLLEGQTVVLYFNKPSTRTRISFETAVVRLGGIPLSVGPHELHLDRGETAEDTARVISAYAAAFVIRTFRDDDLKRFAAASSIPVVNALTDGHHPCQALADLLTLQEIWDDVRGRRLAYVGDGNNVANSLIQACALLGINITVATPPGYAPESELVASARQVAYTSGSSIRITEDPVVTVRDADAVYTDVWVSMGADEATRERRSADFTGYQVNADLMANALPNAIFMHCLPAHRGLEVTDDVIDGARSVVFQQAANRLPTEQALLWALLTSALNSHL